jgi:hypothetical protein
MSNNIYDILKKMENLEAPKQSLNEGKKAKPDFLDKDGDKKEPMKKAAKEKSKGAIGEAVARVEKQLAEKYNNHKKQLSEREMEESGLQAYLGKKKYGEQGMQALQKAGREGASKEKMAQIRAKHDKMDEGEYNEDMLSPKQKKFAALAEPKDKITYADKIAGAKKKTEGNKFSGNLMKARAQGLKQADLDGDGDMEPVHEGWDEMMKAAKERSGPQPRGGSGIKQGTRYGGGRQTDEPDTDNETGEVAKKSRGRPKKDKFAK